MRLHSLRDRALYVTPIRIALGVLWLGAARIAGAPGTGAVLAFAGGVFLIVFTLFNDPRSRFLRRGDPKAAPGRRVGRGPAAPGAARDAAEHGRGVGSCRGRARVPADPLGVPRRDLDRAGSRGSAVRNACRPDALRGAEVRRRVSALTGVYATRVQNWMLTELDSGERIVSERLDHVRSAAVGLLDRGRLTRRGRGRGRRHALHRAPAVQGDRHVLGGRDRRDLRRARRRAQCRDLT